MQYEQITFERRGSVGIVTLNRPDRLLENDLLEHAIATAEHREAIRAFQEKRAPRFREG